MKDIPNFEGKYAITEKGEVWSYKHKKYLKPKIMNGYSRVDLVDKENKVHQCNIHRLVALTFLPNPDDLPCVNHKDEVRTNNHVDNLEWCTYKYNSNYGSASEKIRTNKTAEGWKRCWEASSKARSKPVKCVETGKIYKNAEEAKRILNIINAHINDCCNGKRKVAGGYHWEFMNRGELND